MRSRISQLASRRRSLSSRIPTKQVDLAFEPVAVDEDAAAGRDRIGRAARRKTFDDPHVGHEVGRTRERFFGPVDAGLDLLHPLQERVLGVREPRRVEAAEHVLFLPLVELDVALERDRVNRIFRKQVEPRAQFAAIEQIVFGREKFSDRFAQEELLQAFVRRGLSHSMSSCQRP